MIEKLSLDQAVLDAANEVFQTMIFMDLQPAQEDAFDTEADSLLGSITFKGDLEGCFVLCANNDCAYTVAANMLGMDSPEGLTEEEVCDAVGEVVNMVMGSIKSRLPEQDNMIEVSIPSVVRGKRLQNNLGEGAQKITKYVSIQGEFTAVLSLLYRAAN